MSDKKKQITRRSFLKTAAAATGTATIAGCSGGLLGSSEAFALEFQEYFKEHYRLMTDEERTDTIERLERLSEIKKNTTIDIDSTKPQENVLYGYAFNVTRCEGFMECVDACVKENNLDRESKNQYIRIFEMENGEMLPDQGDGKFFHQVPRKGHFYMGVQCFQCENPPCVKACPTKATWKEKDGIVVVDYDWCIGCRYCMAACPYWGRRFNWNQPQIPKKEVNKKQHYLGNRSRVRGMMEKCTFCIQRSRKGKVTACVEACPTGARVFGNLLDPDSEIRFVLKNKKVYRLKEDLGTDPKFWYFND
ncbi:MAG: 4Fe-4S dicluster domain-containing protein [Desulfobacterales bacterium]|nr:4Fe-4S dicluster domain-containing protein [Desulfobacterales bacterium]MCP4159501.1 4Fe-4S dicluster domain-containing protein [Deltaproteobacteria bacterium]